MIVSMSQGWSILTQTRKVFNTPKGNIIYPKTLLILSLILTLVNWYVYVLAHFASFKNALATCHYSLSNITNIRIPSDLLSTLIKRKPIEAETPNEHIMIYTNVHSVMLLQDSI